MPLINLIIILALIGAALYAINRWIPMEPTIKRIMNIAVIVVVVLWLLSVFGVIGSLSTIRVGR